MDDKEYRGLRSEGELSHSDHTFDDLEADIYRGARKKSKKSKRSRSKKKHKSRSESPDGSPRKRSHDNASKKKKSGSKSLKPVVYDTNSESFKDPRPQFKNFKDDTELYRQVSYPQDVYSEEYNANYYRTGWQGRNGYTEENYGYTMPSIDDEPENYREEEECDLRRTGIPRGMQGGVYRPRGLYTRRASPTQPQHSYDASCSDYNAQQNCSQPFDLRNHTSGIVPKSLQIETSGLNRRVYDREYKQSRKLPNGRAIVSSLPSHYRQIVPSPPPSYELESLEEFGIQSKKTHAKRDKEKEKQSELLKSATNTQQPIKSHSLLSACLGTKKENTPPVHDGGVETVSSKRRESTKKAKSDTAKKGQAAAPVEKVSGGFGKGRKLKNKFFNIDAYKKGTIELDYFLHKFKEQEQRARTLVIWPLSRLQLQSPLIQRVLATADEYSVHFEDPYSSAKCDTGLVAVKSKHAESYGLWTLGVREAVKTLSPHINVNQLDRQQSVNLFLKFIWQDNLKQNETVMQKSTVFLQDLHPAVTSSFLMNTVRHNRSDTRAVYVIDDASTHQHHAILLFRSPYVARQFTQLARGRHCGSRRYYYGKPLSAWQYGMEDSLREENGVFRDETFDTSMDTTIAEESDQLHDENSEQAIQAQDETQQAERSDQVHSELIEQDKHTRNATQATTETSSPSTTQVHFESAQPSYNETECRTTGPSLDSSVDGHAKNVQTLLENESRTLHLGEESNSSPSKQTETEQTLREQVTETCFHEDKNANHVCSMDTSLSNLAHKQRILNSSNDHDKSLPYSDIPGTSILERDTSFVNIHDNSDNELNNDGTNSKNYDTVNKSSVEKVDVAIQFSQDTTLCQNDADSTRTDSLNKSRQIGVIENDIAEATNTQSNADSYKETDTLDNSKDICPKPVDTGPNIASDKIAHTDEPIDNSNSCCVVSDTAEPQQGQGPIVADPLSVSVGPAEANSASICEEQIATQPEKICETNSDKNIIDPPHDSANIDVPCHNLVGLVEPNETECEVIDNDLDKSCEEISSAENSLADSEEQEDIPNLSNRPVLKNSPLRSNLSKSAMATIELPPITTQKMIMLRIDDKRNVSIPKDNRSIINIVPITEIVSPPGLTSLHTINVSQTISPVEVPNESLSLQMSEINNTSSTSRELPTSSTANSVSSQNALNVSLETPSSNMDNALDHLNSVIDTNPNQENIEPRIEPKQESDVKPVLPFGSTEFDPIEIIGSDDEKDPTVDAATNSNHLVSFDSNISSTEHEINESIEEIENCAETVGNENISETDVTKDRENTETQSGTEASATQDNEHISDRTANIVGPGKQSPLIDKLQTSTEKVSVRENSTSNAHDSSPPAANMVSGAISIAHVKQENLDDSYLALKKSSSPSFNQPSSPKSAKGTLNQPLDGEKIKAETEEVVVEMKTGDYVLEMNTAEDPSVQIKQEVLNTAAVSSDPLSTKVPSDQVEASQNDKGMLKKKCNDHDNKQDQSDISAPSTTDEVTVKIEKEQKTPRKTPGCANRKIGGLPMQELKTIGHIELSSGLNKPHIRTTSGTEQNDEISKPNTSTTSDNENSDSCSTPTTMSDAEGNTSEKLSVNPDDQHKIKLAMQKVTTPLSAAQQKLDQSLRNAMALFKEKQNQTSSKEDMNAWWSSLREESDEDRSIFKPKKKKKRRSSGSERPVDPAKILTSPKRLKIATKGVLVEHVSEEPCTENTTEHSKLKKAGSSRKRSTMVSPKGMIEGSSSKEIKTKSANDAEISIDIPVRDASKFVPNKVPTKKTHSVPKCTSKSDRRHETNELNNTDDRHNSQKSSKQSTNQSKTNESSVLTKENLKKRRRSSSTETGGKGTSKQTKLDQQAKQMREVSGIAQEIKKIRRISNSAEKVSQATNEIRCESRIQNGDISNNSHLNEASSKTRNERLGSSENTDTTSKRPSLVNSSDEMIFEVSKCEKDNSGLVITPATQAPTSLDGACAKANTESEDLVEMESMRKERSTIKVASKNLKEKNASCSKGKTVSKNRKEKPVSKSVQRERLKECLSSDSGGESKKHQSGKFKGDPKKLSPSQSVKSSVVSQNEISQPLPKNASVQAKPAKLKPVKNIIKQFKIDFKNNPDFKAPAAKKDPFLFKGKIPKRTKPADSAKTDTSCDSDGNDSVIDYRSPLLQKKSEPSPDVTKDPNIERKPHSKVESSTSFRTVPSKGNSHTYSKEAPGRPDIIHRTKGNECLQRPRRMEPSSDSASAESDETKIVERRGSREQRIMNDQPFSEQYYFKRQGSRPFVHPDDRNQSTNTERHVSLGEVRTVGCVDDVRRVIVEENRISRVTEPSREEEHKTHNEIMIPSIQISRNLGNESQIHNEMIPLGCENMEIQELLDLIKKLEQALQCMSPEQCESLATALYEFIDTFARACTALMQSSDQESVTRREHMQAQYHTQIANARSKVDRILRPLQKPPQLQRSIDRTTLEPLLIDTHANNQTDINRRFLREKHNQSKLETREIPSLLEIKVSHSSAREVHSSPRSGIYNAWNVACNSLQTLMHTQSEEQQNGIFSRLSAGEISNLYQRTLASATPIRTLSDLEHVDNFDEDRFRRDIDYRDRQDSDYRQSPEHHNRISPLLTMATLDSNSTNMVDTDETQRDDHEVTHGDDGTDPDQYKPRHRLPRPRTPVKSNSGLKAMLRERERNNALRRMARKSSQVKRMATEKETHFQPSLSSDEIEDGTDETYIQPRKKRTKREKIGPPKKEISPVDCISSISVNPLKAAEDGKTPEISPLVKTEIKQLSKAQNNDQGSITDEQIVPSQSNNGLLWDTEDNVNKGEVSSQIKENSGLPDDSERTNTDLNQTAAVTATSINMTTHEQDNLNITKMSLESTASDANISNMESSHNEASVDCTGNTLVNESALDNAAENKTDEDIIKAAPSARTPTRDEPSACKSQAKDNLKELDMSLESNTSCPQDSDVDEIQTENVDEIENSIVQSKESEVQKSNKSELHRDDSENLSSVKANGTILSTSRDHGLEDEIEPEYVERQLVPEDIESLASGSDVADIADMEVCEEEIASPDPSDDENSDADDDESYYIQQFEPRLSRAAQKPDATWSSDSRETMASSAAKREEVVTKPIENEMKVDPDSVKDGSKLNDLSNLAEGRDDSKGLRNFASCNKDYDEKLSEEKDKSTNNGTNTESQGESQIQSQTGGVISESSLTHLAYKDYTQTFQGVDSILDSVFNS